MKDNTFPFNNNLIPRALRGYFLRFFSDQDLLNYTCTSRESRDFAQEELNIRSKINMLKSWRFTHAIAQYDSIRFSAEQYHKLAHLLVCGQLFLPYSFKALNENAWVIAALLGDEHAIAACLGDNIGSNRHSYYGFTVADLLLFAGHWSLLIQYVKSNTLSIAQIVEDRDRLHQLAGSGGHIDFVRQLAPIATIEMSMAQHLDFCSDLLMCGHLTKYLSYAEQYNLDGATLKERHPALHIAAAGSSHWHVCDYLVEHFGYDPSNTEQGVTLLHQAAYHGQKSRFKRYVAENGLNKLADDETGRTPLHYAAMRGHLDIIMLYSVDEWSLEDATQYAVLHYLIKSNSHAALREVLRITAEKTDVTQIRAMLDDNLLMTCAAAGNIEAFELLLPLFGDATTILNYRNRQHYNICLQSMAFGHLDFTLYLLQKFGLECITCYVRDDSADTICHRLIKIAIANSTLTRTLRLLDKVEAAYPDKIKSIKDRNGMTVDQLCQEVMRLAEMPENDESAVGQLLRPN